MRVYAQMDGLDRSTEMSDPTSLILTFKSPSLRFTNDRELFRRSLTRAPGPRIAQSLVTSSLGPSLKGAGPGEAAAGGG